MLKIVFCKTGTIWLSRYIHARQAASPWNQLLYMWWSSFVFSLISRHIGQIQNKLISRKTRHRLIKEEPSRAAAPWPKKHKKRLLAKKHESTKLCLKKGKKQYREPKVVPILCLLNLSLTCSQTCVGHTFLLYLCCWILNGEFLFDLYSEKGGSQLSHQLTFGFQT